MDEKSRKKEREKVESGVRVGEHGRNRDGGKGGRKREADTVDGKREPGEVELVPGKMVVGQQEKIKGKTVRMKM